MSRQSVSNTCLGIVSPDPCLPGRKKRPMSGVPMLSTAGDGVALATAARRSEERNLAVAAISEMIGIDGEEDEAAAICCLGCGDFLDLAKLFVVVTLEQEGSNKSLSETETDGLIARNTNKHKNFKSQQ